MALRSLSLTRGNTKELTLTFKRANGTLYCLKNWAVFFTVKTNRDLADAQASIQKIVTAFSDTTSGTSGVATVTINPSDTVNLSAGEYEYDIKVCTASSANYTVRKGILSIEYDVTRSVGTAGSAA